MVLSSLGSDASIVDYLEHRARQHTVIGLVARTAIAFAVVVGGIRFLGSAKAAVVTFALTYFAYAAWGLLDRARSRALFHEWRRASEYLRLLCSLLVVVGVLSGIGLLLSVAFVLLGSAWVL